MLPNERLPARFRIIVLITGFFAIIGCASAPLQKDRATLINQINAFNFDLPPDIAELEKDDTILIEGDNFKKADVVSILTKARECAAVLQRLAKPSTVIRPGSNDSRGRVSVMDLPIRDAKRHKVSEVNSEDEINAYCDRGASTYFGTQIYPKVFPNLKIEVEGRFVSAERSENSAASKKSTEELEVQKRLSAYARKYGAITVSEDMDIILGAAVGNRHYIGKKIVHTGVLGWKEKGFYGFLGIPSFFLKATGLLTRYRVLDRLTLLLQITGIRRFINNQGNRDQWYTCRVIRVLNFEGN
jgi:hypothetical protein